MKYYVALLLSLLIITGCSQEESYYPVEGKIIKIDNQEEFIELDYGIKIEVDSLEEYSVGQKLKVWILDREDDMLPEFPKVQKVEKINE